MSLSFPYSVKEKECILREILPTVSDSIIEIGRNTTTDPITVCITTTQESKTISKCLKDYYPEPFFIRKVYVSANVDSDFIDMLCYEHKAEVIVYPENLHGDIHLIRRLIEANNTSRYLISDDDPGSNFKNKGYQYKSPRLIRPDLNLKCGAKRNKIDPKWFNYIWNLTFNFGEKSKVAYVGLNTSEQPLPALPGYETDTKSKRGSSFGTYCISPFLYDASITATCGVLRPMRAKMPLKSREITQEWTAASLTAVYNGFGTLIFSPVIANFAVNPPKNTQEDWKNLNEDFPGFLCSGNSAGGTVTKTGYISHFTTSNRSNRLRIL